MIRSIFVEFCRDGSGAAAIERGLIAAVVCLAVLAAFTSLGISMNNVLNEAGSALAGDITLSDEAIRSH
jgi:Flp pilus assembly pilin Flp